MQKNKRRQTGDSRNSPPQAHTSARAAALRSLERCERTGTLHAEDALLQECRGMDPRDRALAQSILYASLRHRSLINAWVEKIVSTNRVLDPDTRRVVRLGLVQILILRMAPHAAVNETVNLGGEARSLVNATLRRALRERKELHDYAETEAPLSIRHSQPQMLIDRWTKEHGAEATEELLRWNNEPSPVYVRVNTLRPPGVADEHGLPKLPGAEPVAAAPGYFLCAATPLAALRVGDVYAQDPSCRHAVELLDPQPGEDILDACAAPGGKTFDIASKIAAKQRESGKTAAKKIGELVAADFKPRRLRALRENIRTLSLPNVRVLDVNWLESGFTALDPKRRFDKILLDAPCSNTGTLRRRVDARWRLEAENFEQFSLLQRRMLVRCARMLKPGGSIVYSTCSLERDENQRVVEAALNALSNLSLIEEKSSLPWRDHFDGAYAALLRSA